MYNHCQTQGIRFKKAINNEREKEKNKNTDRRKTRPQDFLNLTNGGPKLSSQQQR